MALFSDFGSMLIFELYGHTPRAVTFFGSSSLAYYFSRRTLGTLGFRVSRQTPLIFRAGLTTTIGIQEMSRIT